MRETRSFTSGAIREVGPRKRRSRMALRGVHDGSLALAQQSARVRRPLARVTRDVWERKSVAMRSRVTQRGCDHVSPGKAWLTGPTELPWLLARQDWKFSQWRMRGGDKPRIFQSRAARDTGSRRVALVKGSPSLMRGRGEKGRRYPTAQTCRPCKTFDSICRLS